MKFVYIVVSLLALTSFIGYTMKPTPSCEPILDDGSYHSPVGYQAIVDYEGQNPGAWKREYDWIGETINDRPQFPVTASHQAKRLRMVMFQFCRPMSSKKIVAELDRRGFRPASIEELAAFGATYPDAQREAKIFGLMSSWQTNGTQFIPVLDNTKYGRGIGAQALGLDEWTEGTDKFLAIPKVNGSIP